MSIVTGTLTTLIQNAAIAGVELVGYLCLAACAVYGVARVLGKVGMLEDLLDDHMRSVSYRRDELAMSEQRRRDRIDGWRDDNGVPEGPRLGRMSDRFGRDYTDD